MHEEHELGHADGQGSVRVGEINGHQLWLRSIIIIIYGETSCA